MSGESSRFFRISKAITEEFLQTVVIVDDLVGYEERPQEKPIPLQSPKTRPGARIEGTEISTTTIESSEYERPAQPSDADGTSRDDQSILVVPAVETTASSENQTKNAHYLNAKKVIDSFAEKGIVCSILRPTKEERDTLPGKLAKLASCADIVIIDWELHQDNGETAKQILKGIAKSSLGHPAQLRLIMFYTGSQEIAGISTEIKTCLTEILHADIKAEDDGFTVKLEPNRIVVYAKPETKVPEQYKSRIVSFEALAECVTEQFTKMTAGLVSNVAIASLAKIRQNTHKILSRFSSDLDAPYLTHRALLHNPDEAENHLIRLVAEELQAILEQVEVGNKANSEAIETWLNEKALRLQLSKDVSFTEEEVSSLFRNGLEECQNQRLTKTKKENGHKLELTKMFQPDFPYPQCLDEKFAFLTTTRFSYTKPAPKLTLGTILKQESSDAPSYWVCIHPRCDCVRLESETAFLFLPLRPQTDRNKKFNLIIEEDSQYVRLLLEKEPANLRLIRFLPNPTRKRVVSEPQGEFHYFPDTMRCKYKWMGELRPEHAQRISNEFAAKLSRVGVDESEWLRLWATKG